MVTFPIFFYDSKMNIYVAYIIIPLGFFYCCCTIMYVVPVKLAVIIILVIPLFVSMIQCNHIILKHKSDVYEPLKGTWPTGKMGLHPSRSRTRHG